MNTQPPIDPPNSYWGNEEPIDLIRHTITFTVDCEDELDEQGMKEEISNLLQINEDRLEEIISFKLERE